MNFFKSILLEDPDSSEHESHESGEDSPIKPTEEEDRDRHAAEDDNGGDGWSFGGLFQNLAARSESVIETYRRDLQEFGSGLKMETEIIREAASRAVKDLPASLEAGTSAAHGVLDGVIKSTADIISKEVQNFGSESEAETLEANRSLNSGRYSWFDSQLNSIQCEPSTFCDEPEDLEDYRKWKLGFELGEKRDEIDGLIGENGALESVYRNLVPNTVDHELFWCRYFYKVDKLEQQETFRANLVKRAISGEDDDDLTWDYDEDDGIESSDGNSKHVGKVDELKDQEIISGDKIVGGESLKDQETVDESIKTSSLKDQEMVVGDMIDLVESTKTISLNDQETVDGVVDVDKTGLAESTKTSSLKDPEMVDGVDAESMKMSHEDVSSGELKIVGKSDSVEMGENDEMGWDEIGDTGSGDDDEKNDSNTFISDKPIKVDIRKKLNAVEDEDDEDFSWDIEDDDEQLKS